MKIRFVVLPLLLAAALFLAGGCTDKGDAAWGEKQKTLLEELLNKPHIKHGELVIDYKNKQWTIPNIEIAEDDSDDALVVCTIESVTGVDVALEPIAEENGLLAGQLAIKGLVFQGRYGDDEGKIDSFEVKSLKGSKALQHFILNPGDTGSLEMLEKMSVESLTLNGFDAKFSDEVVSLESLTLENLDNGFVGPVEFKNLFFKTDGYEPLSLRVGFMGLKKMGSQALYDEIAALTDSSLSEDEILLALGDALKKVDFLMEDMEYRDVVFNKGDDTTLLTIKKAIGSTSYDGKTVKSVSKLENLVVPHEGMVYFAKSQGHDGSELKPVNLSIETEMNGEVDAKGYTLDYKKIHLSDPSYGSVNLAFRASFDQSPFSLVPTDVNSLLMGKLHTFALTLEDKGILDAMTTSYAKSVDSGEDVAKIRAEAVADLQGQCEQLPANLKKVCEDTAAFLGQSGRIEYSIKAEKPINVVEYFMMNQLDQIPLKSKFTPAK